MFDTFLNPDNFKTSFDTEIIDNEQYQKGLSIGNNSDKISISCFNTWSTDSITSYEKIGTHAGTSSLLKGFLDSKAKIEVYREINNQIKSKIIKE